VPIWTYTSPRPTSEYLDEVLLHEPDILLNHWRVNQVSYEKGNSVDNTVYCKNDAVLECGTWYSERPLGRLVWMSIWSRQRQQSRASER
jgi:hypothetical protein